jgi:hypothetical protein
MIVWIGWDPAEMVAANVATHSLRSKAAFTPSIHRLSMLELRQKGVYIRETDWHAETHSLWDGPSNAPMSSEHAITRFFVPYLAGYKGWALFVDGDVLFRADVGDLFALADDRYAVMVVQHPPLLKEGLKKRNQPQTAYARKNWSSVCLWNAGHPAHRTLTLEELNTWPGRDLHAFKWLKDDEIGALPARWNHLVNVNPPDPDPALVHFTEGTPNLPGHDQDPFADEWFAVASACGYKFPRKVVA